MYKSNVQHYREIKSEINVVPFLDILLVLLLIFMMTTPVVTQNIDVDLPVSSETTDTIDHGSPQVIIKIYGIGKYSLMVDNDRIDQLLLEEVSAAVQHYMQINPKTVFLIGSSKEVPYNEIIKTFNLLRNAGVKSVGLMTRIV